MSILAKQQLWFPHLPLWPFWPQAFWPGLQYQLWIPSYGLSLSSSQKTIGYLHNRITTVSPMGISCFACQGAQLSKTVADKAPLQSAEYHCGHREWSFQLIFSLISLCPATRACSIFISKVLLPSSDGQPTTVAIACFLWGNLRCLCHQECIGKEPTSRTWVFT